MTRVTDPAERIDPRRHDMAADPYRPLYHFLSPTAFLGDPHGQLFWNGRYHLFYQHNPDGGFSETNARMHWGHASSEDLVHWTDLPIAIAPIPGSVTGGGCYSGTAFLDAQGTPTIIHYAGGCGICIWRSRDDMLVSWEGHPANPVIPRETEGDPYRIFDPCGWTEGRMYYALSGGRSPDGRDVAYLFQSQDLACWEYVRPFYEATSFTDAGEDCAVPEFFPIAGKHMLLFASHTRGAQYYIGEYADRKFRPERHGRMNFDSVGLTEGNLFAPASLADHQGRRIFLAWIPEGRAEEVHRASGWSGILSLPRVLSLARDDALLTEPAPEFEILRRDHRQFADIRVAEDAPADPPDVQGNCLEIAAEIEPGDARTFGINVLASPDRDERTVISYSSDDACLTLDPSSSSLSEDVVGRGSQRAPLELAEGESLDLRIFLDRSVVEVFANGRLCLTKRVYPSRPDSVAVRLFARGGTAVVRSMDVWRMAPVWPEAPDSL